MEIRAIIGKDGETYYNGRDLAIHMQSLVNKQALPTASMMSFVRRFIIELITARR